MDGGISLGNTTPEIILVCSFCERRRDDSGAWQPVDRYLEKYPYAFLSHGICPECAKLHYGYQLEAALEEGKE